MKRDLARLADERHDLLIVGGGITGAAIAWEASRRGLRVALVERRDFGGATSAATSKLVHGGLRYLKRFELGLVRESLRERRVLELIAPHLVHPLPFVLPTHGTGERAVLTAGLSLYDLLGFDRGRLPDRDARLPGHRHVVRRELIDLFPALAAGTFDGGFLYYDCRMVSPERLTLAFLASAETAGAALANWVEVVGFENRDGRLESARVRDEATGAELEIRADAVVNAAGCWSDRLMELASGRPSAHHVVRSKGIHVILPQYHASHALALVTPDHRHVFLLPWRGLTIAGTTDTPYTGDPDAVRATDDDVDMLLAELASAHPGFPFDPDDVLYAYAGLRPLSDPTATSTYDASRRHEVVDHAAEGGPANLLSALGGKYTTSRALAEGVVDQVAAKLGREVADSDTARTPLAGATAGPWSEVVARAQRATPELAPEVVEHLAIHHGTGWRAVVEIVRQRPELGRPLRAGAREIRAELVLAAREESVVHLEDALLRRTSVAAFGPLPEALVSDAAALVGAELGWDDARKSEEITRVRGRR